MSRLPPALAAYRALTVALEPLAPMVLSARARRGKEDARRLGERLGRTSIPRPPGALVWLHGASVGEAMSILPLVEALRRRRHDLGLLVTSGTTTSAALVARRAPAGVIHQYAPIDAPKSLDRFLAHWRPDLAIMVESEVWPNLIHQAGRRGVALALVSARMSDASLRNWGRIPQSADVLFGAFRLVMAQDESTAAALARLGGHDDGRLNLKLAGEPLPVDPDALDRVRATVAERPVLLAASTHPGEEALALEAFQPLRRRGDRPLLVVVPRHPGRGPEVAQLAHGQGLSTTLQSSGQDVGADTEVHVADGLGELGLWFRLARAAFVGGSLVEGPGGHNPLEPARLGTLIVSGPYVRNWRSVHAVLGDAVARVEDAAGLSTAFATALDHPDHVRAWAAEAMAAADVGGDQLDEAVRRLLELVP